MLRALRMMALAHEELWHRLDKGKKMIDELETEQKLIYRQDRAQRIQYLLSLWKKRESQYTETVILIETVATDLHLRANMSEAVVSFTAQKP